ncbi:MAG: BACON domain-containing carbohydrate-binding protein [Acidobacteriota bacterium]
MLPLPRPIAEATRSAQRCHSRLLLVILAAVALVVGCSSSSTVTTGPTGAKCQVALAASSSTIGSEGGPGTVVVTTSPECPWDVSSSVTWLSGLSPVSGQGTGTVEFRAAANPLPAVREGEIVVNGNRLRVSQQAQSCRFELRPGNLTIDAGGGVEEIAVSTASSCSWTVATDVSWMSFTTPVARSGEGVVGVRIAANQGAEPRVGAVTVGDQRVIVTQAAEAVGSPSCVYVVTSTSPPVLASDAAQVSASVTAAGGCAWTATSSVPWIAVTAGASGTGNGAVALSVAANPGSVRTGTIIVAGQIFTVTQAAAAVPCTYAISPATASIAAPGGTGTTAVAAGTGCSWTATSNAAWLTVTAGASGAGNGSVAFSAAANAGSARTGTITVASRTFAVTQAAAATPCSYAINPATAAYTALGGNGTVAVATGTGCAWTTTSNAAWITVTTGASGSGNGAAGFSVAVNLGSARTGTITVAGQTFSVTQAAVLAPCTYAISPTSVSRNGRAGTGTVVVSTGADCAWTAASNTSWITVTTGASGQGGGTVGFAVSANPSRQDRIGTVTIAGRTFTVTQR